MRLESSLLPSNNVSFIEELNNGFLRTFNYTLLIKRNLLDMFTDTKVFGKISKRTSTEITYLINLSRLRNPAYSFFISRPKKHLLVKCYKDVLKV